MANNRSSVRARISSRRTLHSDHFYRMFRNGRYALASAAFLRAGRERQAKICDAYLLQEKAGLVSITAGAARIQAFLTAANAFSACARDCSSRQEKERLTCYEAAGDCYSEARDHKRAGDNYRSAELYDKSARAYGEGGRIDEMVEVFTRYKINSVLHVQLVEAARIHYFKVRFNGRLVYRYI